MPHKKEPPRAKLKALKKLPENSAFHLPFRRRAKESPEDRAKALKELSPKHREELREINEERRKGFLDRMLKKKGKGPFL